MMDYYLDVVVGALANYSTYWMIVIVSSLFVVFTAPCGAAGYMECSALVRLVSCVAAAIYGPFVLLIITFRRAIARFYGLVRLGARIHAVYHLVMDTVMIWLPMLIALFAGIAYANKRKKEKEKKVEAAKQTLDSFIGNCRMSFPSLSNYFIKLGFLAKSANEIEKFAGLLIGKFKYFFYRADDFLEKDGDLISIRFQEKRKFVRVVKSQKLTWFAKNGWFLWIMKGGSFIKVNPSHYVDDCTLGMVVEGSVCYATKGGTPVRDVTETYTEASLGVSKLEDTHLCHHKMAATCAKAKSCRSAVCCHYASLRLQLDTMCDCECHRSCGSTVRAKQLTGILSKDVEKRKFENGNVLQICFPFGDGKFARDILSNNDFYWEVLDTPGKNAGLGLRSFVPPTSQQAAEVDGGWDPKGKDKSERYDYTTEDNPRYSKGADIKYFKKDVKKYRNWIVERDDLANALLLVAAEIRLATKRDRPNDDLEKLAARQRVLMKIKDALASASRADLCDFWSVLNNGNFTLSDGIRREIKGRIDILSQHPVAEDYGACVERRKLFNAAGAGVGKFDESLEDGTFDEKEKETEKQSVEDIWLYVKAYILSIDPWFRKIVALVVLLLSIFILFFSYMLYGRGEKSQKQSMTKYETEEGTVTRIFWHDSKGEAHSIDMNGDWNKACAHIQDTLTDGDKKFKKWAVTLEKRLAGDGRVVKYNSHVFLATTKIVG